MEDSGAQVRKLVEEPDREVRSDDRDIDDRETPCPQAVGEGKHRSSVSPGVPFYGEAPLTDGGSGCADLKMQVVTEASLAEISDAGLTVIIWDFIAAEHAALSDPRIRGVITDDVPGALAARASR